MKVILKSLTGKQHEKEFPPESTIGDVKKTLEVEYETATLRLCRKGVVLDDKKTLRELEFVEGDTVIIAGKKRKLAQLGQPTTAPSAIQPPSVTSTPSPSPTLPVARNDDNSLRASDAKEAGALAEVPQSSSQPESQPQAVSKLEEPTDSTVGPAQPSSTAANPIVAEADGTPMSLIDEIVAMGFPDRDLVALALRAAYLNPDRAVEYLCSSFPRHVLEKMAADASSVRDSNRGSRRMEGAAAAPPSSGSPTASSLRAALSTIPQFDEICSIVQGDRGAIPVVMESLQTHYPNIFAMAQQNPQEFLRIVTGSTSETNPSTTEQVSGGASRGSASRPIRVVLDQLPEDTEPVRRLVDLGGGMWDEQAALIVYLTSNRNEELAANILFDHGGVPFHVLETLARGMDEGEHDDDSVEE